MPGPAANYYADEIGSQCTDDVAITFSIEQSAVARKARIWGLAALSTEEFETALSIFVTIDNENIKSQTHNNRI